ncbi:MAG: hypothetical protein DRJ42_16625 [Deltaproteobacteria bacterium]|nr:MAG: hypothetical protein DRJ42_16625 [Deltaproteobacteria bacterium]
MRDREQAEIRRYEGIRFAGLSLAVSVAMAFFKISVAIMTGSHALLANAFYSINDVLSAIAAAVSLKLANRAPDEDYPFGYGKAEYVAVGMVSLTIAIGVCAMFVFSVVDIIQGVEAPPHYLAIGIAALSFVVSWTLSKRGRRLAIDIHSPVLATTADHQHADALGSIAAIVGVSLAVAGFHAVDRVIAVAETLHLIALSGTLLSKAVKGLMDQAVSDDDLDMMERTCLDMNGVEDVSYLRSRRLGSLAWVDLGISVDPKLNVRQAREIGERVRSAVDEALGDGVVTQVHTHARGYAPKAVAAGGSGHG